MALALFIASQNRKQEKEYVTYADSNEEVPEEVPEEGSNEDAEDAKDKESEETDEASTSSIYELQPEDEDED